MFGKDTNYSLIAMSTAAIGAIYTAGFIATEPLKESQIVIEHPQSFQVQKKSTNLTSNGELIFDGQYSGVGRSRFGDLQLLLTMKQGIIVSAKFGWINTSYPSSIIKPLLDQIVLKQGKEIDLISGATASAQAVQDAVGDAFKAMDDGQITISKVKISSPFYDYKNGIYKTELEDFEVKITVEEGKINSVGIQRNSPFNSNTENMDIIFERVEGQVIKIQNSKIDLWAGATDSIEQQTSKIDLLAGATESIKTIHETLEILIRQATKK